MTSKFYQIPKGLEKRGVYQSSPESETGKPSWINFDLCVCVSPPRSALLNASSHSGFQLLPNKPSPQRNGSPIRCLTGEGLDKSTKSPVKLSFLRALWGLSGLSASLDVHSEMMQYLTRNNTPTVIAIPDWLTSDFVCVS